MFVNARIYVYYDSLFVQIHPRQVDFETFSLDVLCSSFGLICSFRTMVVFFVVAFGGVGCW